MKNCRVSLEAWGLRSGPGGILMIGNHGIPHLAATYGTPLHVVHEVRLEKTARHLREVVTAAYPGRTSVHYAMKCNGVPAVVMAICRSGLHLEVMTPLELALAQHLGVNPISLIVNGPCKTRTFLRRCLRTGVRFIIVDSLSELRVLDELTQEEGMEADLLLRVNPDYVPRGMNRGTATASRTGCGFGLDLKGGEVPHALDLVQRSPLLRFHGWHLHIGTGVQDPDDYARALSCLPILKGEAGRRGYAINVLDVGGGFPSPTSRELSTGEMLRYQILRRLPDGSRRRPPDIHTFAGVISSTVQRYFPAGELPEIIYEPGRCIAGPNQFLLLTVHYVKARSGAGCWLVTDGGLSTVSKPTYYEYHEVLLCNDVQRPVSGKATIIGPACFPGDVVYRNKPLPEVRPGEVLAVMDSGAYFTPFESSFGFPRPAIVAVNGADVRIVRSRESFEESVARDISD